MHEFLPIESFDAIYLVDICEPLLNVARKRFAERGWKNVHVVHQDATSFVLPEVDGDEQCHAPRAVNLVTLSYSLSMVCMIINALQCAHSTFYRFRTSIPHWTTFLGFSRPMVACCLSSISILPELYPVNISPLRTLIGSVAGSLAGFGKFGLTSTASCSVLSGESTLNTSSKLWVFLFFRYTIFNNCTSGKGVQWSKQIDTTPSCSHVRDF